MIAKEDYETLDSWSFVRDYETYEQEFDEMAEIVCTDADLLEYYQTYHGRDPTPEELAEALTSLLPASGIWKAIEEDKGFAHTPPGTVDDLRYRMARYIIDKYLSKS